MARPHITLGVAEDASPDEVRAAYRALASKYHPDREGGDITKFRQVRAAYEALAAKHAERGLFDDVIDEVARELKERRA